MKNIFTNKKFKYGLNATILTIVVIGIVILLNLLLKNYSYKVDITKNKIFQLSEQTINTLETLDNSGKTLDVYLFTAGNSYLDQKRKNLIEGILEQYDKLSENLNLKTRNINKNPSLARKYGVNSGYDIVFDMQGRTKTVPISQMFKGKDFNGEAKYTGAIIHVMNENPPVVYFIGGHKEASINKDMSYLKNQIEREGYVIKTLNIALENKIPNDASMVIDVGAQKQFPQQEIKVLKEYLNNGGKAIFLTSTYSSNVSLKSINEMFNSYGINVNKDIVLDSKRNFRGAQNLVMPVYQSHPIVNKLNQQNQYYMAMPDARSISVLEENKDNINIKSLIKSSSESWGETNLTQYKNGNVELNDADKKGPLTLGVHISKSISKDKKMELVVVGNDLFTLDTGIRSTRSGANLEFMLNSMNSLSPDKKPITIRPKPLEMQKISLPYNTTKLLFFVLVFIIPGLVLATGFIVWLRRRHL